MNYWNLSMDFIESEKLLRAVILGNSQYFHRFLPPENPPGLKNEEKSLPIFGRRVVKITILKYNQYYSITKSILR